MDMTIEDANHYKENAVKILRRNTQYATAKATEQAFDLLIMFLEMERIEKEKSLDSKNGTN